MTGPTQTGVQKIGAALTDGTGVSPSSLVKYVKDFVADFLMGASAALIASPVISAVGLTVNGVPTTVSGWAIVGFAVVGALVRAAYRTVLRWAVTP